MAKNATKNESERREFLASLNLNPDAPALEKPKASDGICWAPVGIDPHTMPITDIVFDPAMVAQFADLSPRNRRAASDYLFAAYKSYGRNKDRNSLLHRRIGEFLASVHKERTNGGESGGFVKEKIRLANTFAEHGITEQDMIEFLAWKAQQ